MGMKEIFALALLSVMLFFALLPSHALNKKISEKLSPLAAVQKEEMNKFKFLIGNWKGEGWVFTPDGKRREFRQTEKIQTKLNGLAILIEGEGKDKASDEIAFRSLAVINYDQQSKGYRFVSQTQEGAYISAEAKAIEGGIEWGFQTPQGGHVRYTIQLNEKGEWFEIGEFSSDGQNWRKFFEMILQRNN
jgi:hypothetical protein